MSEELPRGWCRVRVGDLARPNEQPVLTGPFGTNIGREDFVRDGCAVLTIGCLTDAGIRLDKAMFVREEKARELDRYRLREGDLLFSRMASVGRAGMVPSNLDGALFNYHIMRLRLSDSMMLPNLFLAYVRGAPAVRKYLEDVNHGATRDGINTSQLVAMPVSLPPLNEQRRIVARLEALQARSRRAREALDAVPPLLEKMRQTILAAAFRGDLTKDWRAKHSDVEPASELLKQIRRERRAKWEEAELAKMKANGKAPTDDRWKEKYKEPEAVDTTGLPKLPEGWGWSSVEELTYESTYGTSAKSSGAGEGIPVLGMGNIRDGELVYEKLKTLPVEHDEFPTLLLREGDLLFNRTNSAELVGKTAVFRRSHPCSFASYLIRLRSALVEPDLIAHYVNSPFGRSWVASVASQQVGQANVNGSKLAALAVPIPPAEERAVLLARVSAAVAKVRTGRSARATLLNLVAKLDRAVLAKAFLGELVPQDPNDESAEAMVARLNATKQTNGAHTSDVKTRGRRAITRSEEA